MKSDNLTGVDLSSQIEYLKESSESYKNFFDNLPNAVSILDKEGLFFEVNEATSKMFGYPKSFFKGKSSSVLRAPGEDKNTGDLEKALKGEIVEFEFWGIHSNGDVFPITVSISKGYFFGQDVIYAVAVDKTDIKRYEDDFKVLNLRLKESDRLRSSFLANLSYEIRTPLNGILGFTSLLQDSEMERDERKKFLEIIKKSGERMLLFLDDLINISKIESGEMVVSNDIVDISRLLADIHGFFFPEVRSKGLDLVITIDPLLKEGHIDSDRDKLYGILNNLVQNAIKYSDTGKIEIFCYPKRDGIEFAVKDEGVGIDKENQAGIFERTLQVNPSERLSTQGDGLGLAISRSYVELLGGKIWVESKPYKGSSFYFSIPNVKTSTVVNMESADLSRFPLDQEGELRNLKVLIAEDNKDSALFLSKALKPIVGEITVTYTGRDVVQLFRDNQDIDLILMDIKMPEMDGYEATREIRTFNQSVVIIAQTAFGLIGDASKAIDAGCNDHISKPIRIDALKEIIKTYFSDSK